MSKQALLVGIERYESGTIPRLECACRDVYGVGQSLLSHCGFDRVCILADRDDEEFGMSRIDGIPTEDAILNALRAAADELREEDTFFMLFAGHGLERREGETVRACLLARNANVEEDVGVIEVPRLHRVLSRMVCRHRAIFLDCCRSPQQPRRQDGRNEARPSRSRELRPDVGTVGTVPAPPEVVLQAAPTVVALARDLAEASGREEEVRAARTTILMAACRDGQRAYERDDEKHGAFSFFLRQGLTGAAWRENRLEARDLCVYVERELSQWSQRMGLAQQSYVQQLESLQPVVLAVREDGMDNRRACPECGQKNSVLARRCGECGTNVEGFLALRNAWGRMEPFVREEKWSQVLREGREPTRKNIGQLGPKGRELRRNVKEAVAAAEQHLAGPVRLSSWLNSLRMEFVPVHGTDLLFGRYAVTNGEYRQFRREHNSGSCADATLDEERQPVVAVSWDDARAFCEWLTDRERESSALAPNQHYRLPYDWEWSVAAGLGEPRQGTPEEKDGRIPNVYPWGTQWPPPDGSGNYSDATAERTFAGRTAVAGDERWRAAIKDYDDGYAVTSPVGGFGANAAGLYDMGGNVWEWCRDFYDGQGGDRTLRGGSWLTYDRGRLLASARHRAPPGSSRRDFGFRCVLASRGL